MKWQTVLIVLLVLALASVDLSALHSMTSDLAADLVLALAASQVGLAALWCGAGRGSCWVRLAVAGLIVNTWSSAMGAFGHDMAIVLLSQLGVVLAGTLAWRLRGSIQVDEAATEPWAWPSARVSLADMLALTTVFALLIGPLRTLVPSAAAFELKLLGAALGCQTLALGWSMFGNATTTTRWIVTLVATALPFVASEHLLAPARAIRVGIATAMLLFTALAVVRIAYRPPAIAEAALQPERA